MYLKNGNKEIAVCIDQRLDGREEAYYAIEALCGMIGCEARDGCHESTCAENRDLPTLIYGQPDSHELRACRQSKRSYIWIWASDFFVGDHMQDNRVRGVCKSLDPPLLAFWRDESASVLIRSEGARHISFDIVATTFALLSLYEEYVISQKDSHGRFDRSLAFPETYDFRYRAVIHEYADLLSRLVCELCGPNALPVRHPKIKIVMGIDVDCKNTRVIIGEKAALKMLLRRDFKRLWDYIFDRADLPRLLKWLRLHDMRSTLFVMKGFNPEIDIPYRISLRVLRDWHSEFEVGLHGSYDSMFSKEMFSNEVLQLSKDLGNPCIGLRQHYLRWHPAMWGWAEEAGIQYDSSICAGRFSTGLRNGIMLPYRPYSLHMKRKVNVVEFPILYSDQLFKGFNQCDYAAELDEWAKVFSLLERFGGHLVLMMHNFTFGSLANPFAVKLVERLLSMCDCEFITFREACCESVN